MRARSNWPYSSPHPSPPRSRGSWRCGRGCSRARAIAFRRMTRGFFRRHAEPADGTRLPPGQYLERGFPVLSAGPTPRVPTERWDFAVYGAVAGEVRWTWDEFHQLPRETITKDIQCVTLLSKCDSGWQGV